eukprot:CAMPEP_0117594740 /NCGR_PEP_ID=MMETSP0784-20121206/73372_1 /TAXON_ID=39447 /ORGANISM="" /LENGTH=201 /DNA_ID=CAMNT_0005396839 /DNA_START=203 /DNA_END=808 /DNA_ORIENTATION=-
MVNLVPHVYVYGENGMMFEPKVLRSNFLRMMLSTRTLQRPTPGHDGAWNHPPAEIADRRFRIGFQHYMWTWLEPLAIPGRMVSVRGFKEIRWTAKNLKTIRHICPCSRFISSFRLDVEAQHASNFQGKKSVEQLRNMTAQQHTMLQNLGAATFELPVERFTFAEFNKLAAWLGANCTFASIVHSNDGGMKERPTSDRAGCE